MIISLTDCECLVASVSLHWLPGESGTHPLHRAAKRNTGQLLPCVAVLWTSQLRQLSLSLEKLLSEEVSENFARVRSLKLGSPVFERIIQPTCASDVDSLLFDEVVAIILGVSKPGKLRVFDTLKVMSWPPTSQTVTHLFLSLTFKLRSARC